MDRNSNFMRHHHQHQHLVSRPEPSFGSFLYNYNYDHYPPGIEMMKHQAGAMMYDMYDTSSQGGGMERNPNFSSSSHVDKKKKLTSDQLESLERSFHEEMKLDPDRKMKLSTELGLQPRQISVWFQNRRARWKAKQLERLYDALKQEYDAVTKEKQNLQQEVMKLKTILRDEVAKKQVSTGYTDISGEDTVESTSVAIRVSDKTGGTTSNHHNIADCNNLFNVEEYNPVSPPFWGPMPSYHP